MFLQFHLCWVCLVWRTLQCSASRSAWIAWLTGSPNLKSLGIRTGGQWMTALICVSLPMERWRLVLRSAVTQACTHVLPKTLLAEQAMTWGWLFKVRKCENNVKTEYSRLTANTNKKWCLFHFSSTHDSSWADRAVSNSRISGAAALCCSGFTRAQSIMGEGWHHSTQPSRKIHRPAVRRADYREGWG